MKKLVVSSVLFVLVFCFMSPLAFGQDFLNPQWAKQIVPHFVVGGGYTTIVTITSVVEIPTQINISFGGQDGSPIDVEVTSQANRRYRELMAGFNPGNIMGGGTITLVLTSSSQMPVVGAIGLSSMKSATGDDSAQFSVRYDYAPKGKVVGQAAVMSIARPSLGFWFPAISSGEVQTGLAVANWNPVPAVLNCKVRDTRGAQVVSGTIEIVPWGQVAKFLWQVVTLPQAWTEGKVECLSNVPVFAVTLQTTTNADGLFTFSTGTTFPLPGF